MTECDDFDGRLGVIYGGGTDKISITLRTFLVRKYTLKDIAMDFIRSIKELEDSDS